MPIEISAEKVLTLTEAAKFLPRRRGGKRPHVSTLYRWSTAGSRGVLLETVRVAGTLCTSMEALQRFCDRLTALSQPPRRGPIRSPAAEAAGRVLENHWDRPAERDRKRGS